MSVGDLIDSGSLLLAIPVAVAAGAVSFASPCVLPLVPGYLSYVTGMSGADAQEGGRMPGRDAVATQGAWGRLRAGRQHRTVLGALLFIVGFSAVFVSEGAAFGSVGDVLLQHRRGLDITFGLVMVAMGILFSGLIPERWTPWMQRDMRVRYRPAMGLLGAPPLGVIFGVGWSPCFGPTLAAVQALAFTQGTAGRGALLAAFYCLGLGLPFLIMAVAFSKAMRAVGWLKAHYRLMTRTGGAMIGLVGFALVSGVWQQLVTQMEVLIHGTSLPL